MKTGWFGIPGDSTGQHATLVHVVEEDTHRPLCGSLMLPAQRFQLVSNAVRISSIECAHCRDAVVRQSL